MTHAAETIPRHSTDWLRWLTALSLIAGLTGCSSIGVESCFTTNSSGQIVDVPCQEMEEEQDLQEYEPTDA